MATDITIVSGLPRSGTSLMMQGLAAGGLEVLSDGVRAADDDNPRGYLEFERVKKIKQDTSWLPSAHGKAVKMISQLVFDLPATEQYHILLMERELDEILASQEKMLARLGRPAIPRQQMKTAFQHQIDRFHAWIVHQPNMKVLRVDYATFVSEPREQAARIDAFLGAGLDTEAMASVVEPTLYRNRSPHEPC